MELVIFWILCGVVAGIIGARKGAGCIGFFLGLLFGPFGILFAVISRGNKKQCPACREYIDPLATICPKCHTQQSYVGSRSPSKTSGALSGGLLIVLLILGGFWVHGMMEDRRIEEEHKRAAEASKAAGEKARAERDAAQAQVRTAAEQAKRGKENAARLARLAVDPRLAQREATDAYPELGVADSRLNKEFVARAKRYRAEKADFFKQPDWPLQLAKECSESLAGAPSKP